MGTLLLVGCQYLCPNRRRLSSENSKGTRHLLDFCGRSLYRFPWTLKSLRQREMYSCRDVSMALLPEDQWAIED
jgi:hypothetical protein